MPLILTLGKRSLGKGSLYWAGARRRVLAQRPDVIFRWLEKGDVPHEQVAAWLDCCALVIHGSLMEGAPRAVREAKARGKFVIATAVGGTPECGADVLVPPRDPEALAQAILVSLAQRGL